MREIEFRGRLTNNRGWAYGNLSIKPNNECAIITPDDTVVGKYGKVDIETIGQYTGLKDKNGTKIFEGDILKSKCNANLYNIYWEDNRFLIEDVWGNRIKPIQRAITHFECEVVGNIYDNPELVNGE